MSVELRVNAIRGFITGCKADGTWNAIKACCILAGWDGLTGALVPLKGTAPTNFNFVGGDYSRTTGLVGDGTTKYLDSNRNNNADPQDSKHISGYATTRSTEASVRSYMGTTFASGTAYSSQLITGVVASKLSARLHDATTSTSTGNLHSANGFFAASRNNSSNYAIRGSSIAETITIASNPPNSNNIYVFGRNFDGIPNLYSDARLAFYSIGESVDLALLDARVTTLMNALGSI
tara:strand:+ start:18402 stop:19106 length:705 start_codon:yes stop_codon:yes gene_type:complete